jgi:hypothetical protein
MIELAALYGVLRVVAMNKGIVSHEDLPGSTTRRRETGTSRRRGHGTGPWPS